MAACSNAESKRNSVECWAKGGKRGYEPENWAGVWFPAVKGTKAEGAIRMKNFDGAQNFFIPLFFFLLLCDR